MAGADDVIWRQTLMCQRAAAGVYGLSGEPSRGSSSTLDSFFIFTHTLNCSCTQRKMRREQQTKEEPKQKSVSVNPLFRCPQQSRPSALTPHLS